MSANGTLPTIQQNLNVQIASPQGTLALVSGAAIAVIGSNNSRRGIIFVNAHASQEIWVTPDNQTPAVNQGVPVLPGGQVSFIGDGKLINYNCGWKAIANGANTPLQMLELL